MFLYLYHSFWGYLFRIKEIFLSSQREFWYNLREWLREQGMNVYVYINLIVILVILSIVIYIKWQFPFWNTMPVFHSYDYWRFYCVSKPYIIKPKLSLAKGSGYYNFELVKTYSYDVLSHLVNESMKEDMIDLMKKYYFTTDNTFNTNTIADIDTIMTGQIQPSYVSFYNEQSFDISNNTIFLPVGCITSHCYNVYLQKTKQSLPIYYLDYLSIPNDSREYNSISINKTSHKKKILIQTHLYNQRLQNSVVQISLFKKEGSPIRGLVPFVKYKTFFFSLNVAKKTIPLGDHFTILRIYNENIKCLKELLEERNGFEISITADIPNIVGQIKKGLLYAYVLKKKADICGYYFIRSDKIEWAHVANIEQGTSIQLIASWNKTSYGEIFYRGFLFAMRDMLREDQNKKILKIDDISDNSIILSRWMAWNRSFMENENAYYFYNFIYPYYEGYSMNKKCFILI